LMPRASARAKAPARAVAADPEAVEAELEGLPRRLAESAPELGRASVGWRRQETAGGEREGGAGRCPVGHAAGRTNDGDLWAAVQADGTPYVRCEHTSCTGIPAINARLREAHARERAAGSDAAEPPALDRTPMAGAILADLDGGGTALHE